MGVSFSVFNTFTFYQYLVLCFGTFTFHQRLVSCFGTFTFHQRIVLSSGTFTVHHKLGRSSSGLQISELVSLSAAALPSLLHPPWSTTVHHYATEKLNPVVDFMLILNFKDSQKMHCLLCICYSECQTLRIVRLIIALADEEGQDQSKTFSLSSYSHLFNLPTEVYDDDAM